MEHFSMKDKVALVTGSNRGIGEAYVIELLNAGAKKIYAGARDVANLELLVASNPDVIKPVLLDVTKEEHIQALLKTIDSENAVEIARQEMEVNYFAPLQITKALLAKLKQSTDAAVINISSIAGISNFPVIAPYSATKAAMHSFTQGLRANLVADGIKVVGVYPGPVDTRMADGWDMEKAQPRQVAQLTFEALAKGEVDVLPDDFSKQMYAAFLQHPHELEKIFSEMQ